jgi:hypothetical protein
VTGEPPLSTGAVKEIVASVFPTATVMPVGAFGTVDGIAASEARDSPDVPIPLVAVTLNVYGEPFVSPVISQSRSGAIVTQLPDTILFEEYAVTVYPVIAEPLLLMGTSQDTVAEASDATAVTFIGTDGAAMIAASEEAVDGEEVPAMLVAVTLNV